SFENVERREHGRPQHAGGLALAKVKQPIVVGARDGGGEAWIWMRTAEHVQAARRKEHSDVDTLDVHGLELHVGSPTTAGRFPKDFLVALELVADNERLPIVDPAGGNVAREHDPQVANVIGPKAPGR